ncbi:NAD(P)H-hydrate epimerase [Lacimonas salitolerans]|uniref:NAD(P)H-hydrate epimerase n=1 Tax=Lacimonas salitolerans TaxID=1323750 RepID=A0ABW4EEX5_9RHOB
MAETLTSADMRAVEQAAIESGRVTGLVLMERAGQGVVDAIIAEWPDLATGTPHAAVLCGPGNNGGDGFVVARLLRQRGWRVAVFFHGDAKKLPPDARATYERWLKLGTVAPLDLTGLMQAAAAARADGAETWVVVDALFGIGQRAPLDELLTPVNALIDAIFKQSAAPAPVFVAVDIPTGHDADSGAALARRPLPADLIVTFHALKPIHAMPHMADARCQVVDIGL